MQIKELRVLLGVLFLHPACYEKGADASMHLFRGGAAKPFVLLLRKRVPGFAQAQAFDARVPTAAKPLIKIRVFLTFGLTQP